jgi:hypothetical protein
LLRPASSVDSKLDLARSLDCSRRRPVIHAVRPASMRPSGSTLRIAQHAFRSSTLCRIASLPWRPTKAITASCTGR